MFLIENSAPLSCQSRSQGRADSTAEASQDFLFATSRGAEGHQSNPVQGERPWPSTFSPTQMLVALSSSGDCANAPTVPWDRASQAVCTHGSIFPVGLCRASRQLTCCYDGVCSAQYFKMADIQDLGYILQLQRKTFLLSFPVTSLSSWWQHYAWGSQRCVWARAWCRVHGSPQGENPWPGGSWDPAPADLPASGCQKLCLPPSFSAALTPLTLPSSPCCHVIFTGTPQEEGLASKGVCVLASSRGKCSSPYLAHLQSLLLFFSPSKS